MTPYAGVAEQLSDDMPEIPTKNGHIILLSQEDLERGSRARSDAGANAVGESAIASEIGGEGSTPSEGPDFKLLAGVEGVPEKSIGYRFVKRAFDIAFSTCVITVGLVPGLVLSAFIVADTKGSPIYLSTRCGRHGKKFRILKFRSMVADADDLEKHFTPEQLDQWHREHKVDDDPRITRLGAFLRSSSVDEFPQFVNVFLGQMSTIGSRAVTEEEAEYYGEARDIILSMRPGIAWDIIAPKPGAGEKSFPGRVFLPAYEGARFGAVAA